MRQYAADRITALWLGLELHEGFTAGTFIQPKSNATTWTQKDNGYGGTIQLYNPSKSGKLTMIFDQEHPVHSRLQALANADQISQNIVGPLVIVDLNVREVTTYFSARLESMADPSKSTGGATVPWTWIYSIFKTQTFDPNRNAVGT